MSFDNQRKQVMSCFEQALLGGMKAAFATVENQSVLVLSTQAEDALGWQDEAEDLRDLASACPYISSL